MVVATFPGGGPCQCIIIYALVLFVHPVFLVCHCIDLVHHQVPDFCPLLEDLPTYTLASGAMFSTCRHLDANAVGEIQRMHMRRVKTWFTGKEVFLIEDTLVGEIDLSLQADAMALMRSHSGHREAVLCKLASSIQQMLQACSTGIAIRAWVLGMKRAHWGIEPSASGVPHELADVEPNWGWDPGPAEWDAVQVPSDGSHSTDEESTTAAVRTEAEVQSPASSTSSATKILTGHGKGENNVGPGYLQSKGGGGKAGKGGKSQSGRHKGGGYKGSGHKGGHLKGNFVGVRQACIQQEEIKAV